MSEGGCCLPGGDRNGREDSQDSETPSAEPCGCCDTRVVAGDDPSGLVPAHELVLPLAKLLADRVDLELASLSLVRPEFHQMPERSPPDVSGASVRIQFCSFLV